MKVTDIVKVPNGFTELEQVGSYKFADKDDCLWLIGFDSQINITKSKIFEISIMPIDNNFKWKNGKKIDHEIEPKHIYWKVSYQKNYFLFDSLTEATKFISIIQVHKQTALEKYWEISNEYGDD